MLYLLTSIYGLLKNREWNSISKFLFILLLASSISAFLVGRQHEYDLFSLWCVCFNIIMLYITFNSFSRFKGLCVFFPQINETKLQRIETIATIGAIIVFIADAYVLYKVMFLLVGETINVQEYKNEGGAAEIFSTLVPKPIISLSYLVSPIGYFFISLHFYYLLLNRKAKALKCFLLSLILVLSGLMTLSRSATVSFVIQYVGILLFVFPMLEKKFKKSMLRMLIIVGAGVGALLMIISESRFSERYYIDSTNSNNPIVSEKDQPLLASSLDYFSQWQEHSITLMNKYSPDKLFWGLYNSSGLGVFIKQRIEGTAKTNAELSKKIEQTIGDTASAFHTPFARLLFDFGYIGTVLFVFVFSRIIRRISPQKSVFSFKALLFLPVFFPFAFCFFAGNAFGGMTQNIAIIYNIIIMCIIKK